MGSKKRPIVPWLSANKDGKEGRFIQVGYSLLSDKRFNKLSPGARCLYFCMAIESGGNKEFTFPRSVASKKYGIAKTTFDRQKNELAKKGFISFQSGKNTREKNKYSFCYEWKRRDTS